MDDKDGTTAHKVHKRHCQRRAGRKPHKNASKTHNPTVGLEEEEVVGVPGWLSWRRFGLIIFLG
jgi:hypothetical protein